MELTLNEVLAKLGMSKQPSRTRKPGAYRVVRQDGSLLEDGDAMEIWAALRADRIEVHRRASSAWDNAWEAVREEDAANGRRFDARVCAEKAHRASRAILDAHPHMHEPGRECR